jgi:hypothetical protein
LRDALRRGSFYVQREGVEQPELQDHHATICGASKCGSRRRVE